MLGKLLKHEFKATSRLLLPLFLILAVLTIMDRIVLGLNVFEGIFATISGFITFAYVISIIAVVVVTTVFVIYRFYKNLMTDEGYLMFTLPVKPSELINSKLLVATLWTIVSTIAILLSLIIVFSGTSYFPEIKDGFALVFEQISLQLGSYANLFYIELFVLIIVSIINNILMVYVSIAIGQLINGHKILGSIGAYIVISVIIQIVSVVALGVFSLILGRTIENVSALPQILFPLVIIGLVVTNILYYWGTNFLFKRKLNLD
ncbi:MAG: hypothetical protein K0S04_850 [Herbinix sp.]|nr:hypothetical protein [Herbinix sp.]